SVPDRKDKLSQVKNAMSQRAAEQMEEMDKLLTLLAHDLKHPAGAIEGLLTLIRESPVAHLTGEDAENIELAIGECRRLTGMIEEIVRLARIEPRALSERSVSLPAAARACLDWWAAMNEPGGVEFIIEGDAED